VGSIEIPRRQCFRVFICIGEELTRLSIARLLVAYACVLVGQNLPLLREDSCPKSKDSEKSDKKFAYGICLCDFHCP
jgi:hypothetical protein